MEQAGEGGVNRGAGEKCENRRHETADQALGNKLWHRRLSWVRRRLVSFFKEGIDKAFMA